MPDLIDQHGLTFGEHLYRLAESVGLARHVDDAGSDITARLPDDEATLQLLKDCWNDGYADFLSGADPLNRPMRRPYTQWKFLSVPVEIAIVPGGNGPDNVRGDNARYRLPGSVSSPPRDNWRFLAQDAQLPVMVRDVSEGLVATTLARGTSSGSLGWPQMAAVRRLESNDDQGPGYEVIIGPRPTAAGTLSALFTAMPRRLLDLGSKPVCGSRHDPALRAFAVYRWRARDVEMKANPGLLAFAQTDAASKLDASVSIDKAWTPRTAGTVCDPGVRGVALDRASARRTAGTNTVYTLNA